MKEILTDLIFWACALVHGGNVWQCISAPPEDCGVPTKPCVAAPVRVNNA